MAKTQITREEFQQLLGLFVLARRHNNAIQEIERAAASIVGEAADENSPHYYGQVSDHLVGFQDGSTAEALLHALKIEVVDGPQG